MELWNISIEKRRAFARVLVASLDPGEMQIVACLVRGMSVKAAAARTGLPVEGLDRQRASMMKKLNARRTADLVRIGVYAEAGLLS